MSISYLFKKLGAPLVSIYRSWGSVRPSDGVVFLRVWQDQKFVVDGVQFTRVIRPEKFKDDPGNYGYQERLRHVELVRSGARCYMVMCIAQDVAARPRTIKSFNKHEVFLGGKLVERDGGTWIKVDGRVPVRDVASNVVPGESKSTKGL